MMTKKQEKNTCTPKCMQKEDEEEPNKYMIDDYIDDYWLLNCPNNYSVIEINKKVYNFFH